MNYGLYTAFLGMRARQRTLDAQANNIANASTTGFKAERLLYSSFEARKKARPTTQNLVAGVDNFERDGFHAPVRSSKPGARSMSRLTATLFCKFKPRAACATRAPEIYRLMPTGSSSRKTAIWSSANSGRDHDSENGELSIGRGRNAVAVGKKMFEKLKLVRFNNPAALLTKEGDSLFIATGAEKPQPATSIQKSFRAHSNLQTSIRFPKWWR